MDCPVVKVADAPAGQTELKIRDSRGHRIAFLQVDTNCLDDELMEDLHDFQARHAHDRPDLRIIPPNASASA